jgi:glycosyltransferase involved in cell wall biosynthesis
MSSVTLSVIVIAKNEEQRLPRCLGSAAFADEIIVLDGGSTDRTVEIAKSQGARVEVSNDWQGFGPQKNRALSMATKDWVLSLDADEEVPSELAAEIREKLHSPACDCYEVPRLSEFCGRFLRHSGWYPDYVARLFKRGTARFSDDLVHERLVPGGGVGRLRQPLIHRGYRGASDTLRKIDRYSTAWAEQALAAGRRANFASAPLHGLTAFIKTYLIRRGFLDGQAGFAVAISSAEVTYYKYFKLWSARRNTPDRGDAKKPD